MEQTREEMHEKIQNASNRKILRRQMELLAEYSRMPDYDKHISKASEAMANIHKELIKRECFATVGFIALCYLVVCFAVKRK